MKERKKEGTEKKQGFHVSYFISPSTRLPPQPLCFFLGVAGWCAENCGNLR